MHDRIDLLSRKLASAEEERQAQAAELAEMRLRLDRVERAFTLLADFCGQTMETFMATESDGRRVFVRFLVGVTALASPVLPAVADVDELLRT